MGKPSRLSIRYGKFLIATRFNSMTFPLLRVNVGRMDHPEEMDCSGPGRWDGPRTCTRHPGGVEALCRLSLGAGCGADASAEARVLDIQVDPAHRTPLPLDVPYVVATGIGIFITHRCV